MKPRTVLALVTEAYGAGGGIAQYNRDLLGAMAEAEAVARIVVLPRLKSPRTVQPLPKIEQQPERPGRLAFSLAALRLALGGRRYDLVFCGHLYLAPLAALVAALCRAQLVIQLHGIEAWPPPSLAQRKACDRADLILCVSRYTRARVLEWLSIAPERVLVQPNTVNAEFRPADGISLRRQLNLGHRKVLLTVGRLHPEERYKGHDQVIGLLPALVAAGLDAVYVIAGEGEDANRLQALARQTGVSERVLFVGRVEDVSAFCAMADLFVMPSSGEGFGIAFLEAMACGVPALGLGLGGAPDPLLDGGLGVMAKPCELLAEMRGALENPRLTGPELAKQVEEHFGVRKFRGRIAALMDHDFRAWRGPSSESRL